MNNTIQLIEQKLVESLNDVPTVNRYGYNIVMSDLVFDQFSDKDIKYLQDRLKTECNGRIIHNSFIANDTILLIDMKKSVESDRIVTLVEDAYRKLEVSL